MQRLAHPGIAELEIPAITVNNDGSIHTVPSVTSSKNDFDFYIGKWKVLNRKLQTRLQNADDWIEFDATEEMHTVLLGNGNLDQFSTTIEGKPFEGMTLRLFNPQTKLWSIYWADTNKGVLDPPVIGSFEDNVGYFWGNDQYESKNILVVFRWDARDAEHPVWSQAFSADNGITWEWNWYMYFSKIN
jgi:hypothetical protein